MSCQSLISQPNFEIQMNYTALEGKKISDMGQITLSPNEGVIIRRFATQILSQRICRDVLVVLKISQVVSSRRWCCCKEQLYTFTGNLTTESQGLFLEYLAHDTVADVATICFSKFAPKVRENIQIELSFNSR